MFLDAEGIYHLYYQCKYIGETGGLKLTFASRQPNGYSSRQSTLGSHHFKRPVPLGKPTNCTLPGWCRRRRYLLRLCSHRCQQHEWFLPQPNQWRGGHVHVAHRERGDPRNCLLHRWWIYLHKVFWKPRNLHQQHSIPRPQSHMVHPHTIMDSRNRIRPRIRHRHLHLPGPENLVPRLQLHARRPPRPPIRMPQPPLRTHARKRFPPKSPRPLELRLHRRNVHHAPQHQPRRAPRRQREP